MDTELKSKLQALLQVNQQLKAETESLRNDLYDCIDAVQLVFGRILNNKGQFSMQKALQLIQNPDGLEISIQKLMEAIEKHGQTERPQ